MGFEASDLLVDSCLVGELMLRDLRNMSPDFYGIVFGCSGYHRISCLLLFTLV